ncbi:MAG: hypothetical protein C5B47_03695 [Verrucomicrobia bacterium]|nr:MAG: hypothetical protein C5B47_03695 [Verrucomicrobiota bacterium]
MYGFLNSLKNDFSRRIFSLTHQRDANLRMRIEEPKRRTVGAPESYPLEGGGAVKEKNAGAGSFGMCERFYSSQYEEKNDEEAECIKIGRIYIKKTVRPDSEIPEEDQEYEKLDLLKKLKHRNIVEYVHIDPENRTVTMKDTGFSLNEIRETVRFSFYEDLYIYLEVLNGVKYLHDQGICHIDLNEDNITLQKDGTVKIIDFGLAEDVSNRSGSNENKFWGDRYWLSENLRSLLERHFEIEKSGNPNEKKHYKLIEQIAPRDKELLPYSDLMRLKIELEKMSEFFPKWGSPDLPSNKT